MCVTGNPGCFPSKCFLEGDRVKGHKILARTIPLIEYRNISLSSSFPQYRCRARKVDCKNERLREEETRLDYSSDNAPKILHDLQRVGTELVAHSNIIT